MELLFLWINNHINILNQGFTFSSKFKFDYEVNFEDKSFKLKATKSNSDIENFFGKKILNVCGIVGDNGTGKSNLLDFLSMFLTNNTLEGSKWLSVFYNRTINELQIVHSLFEVEIQNLRVQNSEKWKVIIDSKETKFEKRVAEIGRINMYNQAFLFGVKELEKAGGIFYSPFLDFRERSGRSSDAGKKLIDVSQNYIIRNDIEELLTQEDDPLKKHKFSNVERQFKFVENNLHFVQEVKLPSEVLIRFYKTFSINRDDLGFEAREFKEKFDLKWRDEIHEIDGSNSLRKRKITDIQRLTIGLKKKLKLWFIKNLMDCYFHNLAEYKDVNGLDFPIYKMSILENKVLSKSVLLFFRTQNLIANEKFNVGEYILYVFKIIDGLSQDGFYENEDECFFFTSIDTARRLTSYHLGFIKSFKKDPGVKIDGFMGIDWRAISSGEKALLDLFSRLDSGFEKLNKENKLPANSIVYLLIDEGDISFHPRWQKAYLNKLLLYLNTKSYQIQLFLTTHSPYIISDLPHNNVLLLRRINNAISIHSFSKRKKTFGANIHELLGDSFFMDESLFGDFAKKKIEELFLWYTDKIQLDKNYVKKVIDLIDEPNLSYKLNEMYNEKLGLGGEISKIKNQIKSLQEELEKLEDNDKNSRYTK